MLTFMCSIVAAGLAIGGLWLALSLSVAQKREAFQRRLAKEGHRLSFKDGVITLITAGGKIYQLDSQNNPHMAERVYNGLLKANGGKL